MLEAVKALLRSKKFLMAVISVLQRSLRDASFRRPPDGVGVSPPLIKVAVRPTSLRAGIAHDVRSASASEA
jgi:hypothetical protein